MFLGWMKRCIIAAPTERVGRHGDGGD